MNKKKDGRWYKVQFWLYTKEEILGLIDASDLFELIYKPSTKLDAVTVSWQDPKVKYSLPKTLQSSAEEGSGATKG